MELGLVNTSTKALEGSLVLYKNLDNDVLQKKTSQYFAHYDTKFPPNVICGATGLYAYTASGRKVLDWTSGEHSASTLASHIGIGY